MQNMAGKKLFNDHSSSEDDDSISSSEEEDEDAPLIHSIRRSSKLRSLGLSREGSKGQTKTGNSVGAVDNISASRTSGASN
ncbi:sister-chromatide cohesion protein [Trifolium pratense]|nr:sister-chromatide cohesion protein [Trifolium pratense]